MQDELALSNLRLAESAPAVPPSIEKELVYSTYRGEEEIDDIILLVQDELSEPYSIFTVRLYCRSVDRPGS